MKRNSIVICCLCITAITIAIGVLIRPQYLGNINHNFSEPTSSTSTFSFFAEAGDKIKFSFSSGINKGTLDIVLYDSNGNVVHELDYAKELEEWIILDKEGEYILSAEYSNFVGKFKVAVSRK